jgi:uncharacterized RDD family membrane protein YckC
LFCPNHPDAPADQTCASCRKSFCRDCVVEIGGQGYCANCKEERVRDLKSGVSQGPELASRGSRFGAQLVDGLVLAAGFLLFAGLAILQRYQLPVHNGTNGYGLGYRLEPRSGGYPPWPATLYCANVVSLIGAFVYEWKMVAASGQTLGKRALGIKVVSDDGSPLGSHAWKRPLWRYLFTFMSCIGFIDPLMIFSERNRTLHDRLAKTLVIRARR